MSGREGPRARSASAVGARAISQGRDALRSTHRTTNAPRTGPGSEPAGGVGSAVGEDAHRVLPQHKEQL